MDVQLLDDDLIRRVTEEARRSPRLRCNYNFHSGPEDNPHRFLNVLLEGTYVTPHRHLTPPKSEMFVALEGFAVVFRFDDDGRVSHRYLLGNGPLPERLPAGVEPCPVWGIDFPPGVWHSVAAITPCAVCLEVKPGPWNPATDKEFASWAPRENSPGAAAYLEGLLHGAPER